jgi:hypothetical protein
MTDNNNRNQRTSMTDIQVDKVTDNNKDQVIFSSGVTAFGDELVLTWWETISRNYPENEGYTIVSVGSGTGKIEELIQKRLNRPIICIDPDPYSFSIGVTGIMPHYPLIEDYLTSLDNIKERKIKNKTVLFINWSDPREDYDIKAVTALNPDAIFFIGESFRYAAGSLKLWVMFRSLLEEQDQTKPKRQYFFESEAFCVPSRGYGSQRFVMYWLTKCGQQPLFKLDKKHTGQMPFKLPQKPYEPDWVFGF